jgi:GTP-binding protein EngB required for normal cell division
VGKLSCLTRLQRCPGTLDVAGAQSLSPSLLHRPPSASREREGPSLGRLRSRMRMMVDGIGSAMMDLREYEQHKFAIAEILRSVATTIPNEKTEWRERIRDLFARLAEDRFNLVVVGRFSRGKTSLMNAILATDRLPTGITPLTSAITTVAYGSEEKVVLRYERWTIPKEISIEALPQYVTQQGNPGNIQGIKTAEVQLPAEILRRGFYFVDTPGLGSVIVENTLTTEAFLPEADAFILVTSYESPLSEEEIRFFKAASSSRRRIFVVLNKHDTVSGEERRTALGFVRDQLHTFFGQSIPQVFSVSAQDGLEAKRSCDASRLAASGIPELENELLGFLLTEKSTEFLFGMCDRVRKLMQELPRSPETISAVEKIGALAGQFARIREDESALSELAASPTAAFPNLQRLRSCEVCAQVAEKIWDFLARYQYEISHDQQQSFANRGGFCPFHTWEYESIASPYGTCTGYPTLFDRLATDLRAAASAETQQGVLVARIQALLPMQDSCPLCGVRNKAELDAIEAVARRLIADATRTLNSLSAICHPHLAMLAAAVSDADLTRQLMKRQATILERISEDMRRYALKRDAVRRYLASQEDTTAAQRALMFLAGRSNVNFKVR